MVSARSTEFSSSDGAKTTARPEQRQMRHLPREWIRHEPLHSLAASSRAIYAGLGDSLGTRVHETAYGDLKRDGVSLGSNQEEREEDGAEEGRE
jgi:hypothetical protein